MRLRIKNESRFLDNDTIRKAARYYISRLIGEQTPDIHVSVEFKESMRNYEAYCEWAGNCARPKKFKIVMSTNLGSRRLLECLAHEMVHVKQYAKGELKDYAYSNHVKWHGVKMRYDEEDDEQYFESPWEIEAYGRTVGLYNGFKHKHLGNKDPQ